MPGELTELSAGLERVEALLGRIADAVERGQRPEAAHQLLDFARLCKLLGIGESTGERWKAAGLLPPHVRLGSREYRWALPAVLRWLEGREENVRSRKRS